MKLDLQNEPDSGKASTTTQSVSGHPVHNIVEHFLTSPNPLTLTVAIWVQL